MTDIDPAGLHQAEAERILREAGIPYAVEYTQPPFSSFGRDGRTPRVIRWDGTRLLVSFFRDGDPED